MKRTCYWKNDQLRNGRVQDPDGTVRWFQKGFLHREDGPAVQHPDGRKEWWIDGYPATGK